MRWEPSIYCSNLGIGIDIVKVTELCVKCGHYIENVDNWYTFDIGLKNQFFLLFSLFLLLFMGFIALFDTFYKTYYTILATF